ncbi:hypothetical protein Ga0074812_14031 [Parafrankia irregularis]|uniref:Uncharacterized protein n=1 Tax=Parafrankia irregularis TaxID=795642 RepID=A0A0S4QY28_9ACTN|nr:MULTISPECIES: hypothetical protein [Parafrankia]MBE3203558.1 hypothetical protein [Parafrankia sp. CH37]CUU60455.1 hypothetical protein Ga0074812_14031 [Parafrankia irregularis]
MTPTTGLLAALSLPLIVVTLGYILLCWVRPFGPCPHCHGTARTESHFTRRTRPCRHCDHTGLRLRVGRRACNALRRLLP